MPQIEFSELPEHLRVKLTERGREELWHRVNEFGGIKQLSESFDFSQSKMYNWKNKDLALPVKFVRRLMGQNATSEIVLLKGEGSGGKIENPVFPLEVSDEFITRVEASVAVNKDGVPSYISNDRGRVERFSDLLEEVGRFSYTEYQRGSIFELRFPKFIYEIVSEIESEQDQSVLFDEEGSFFDGEPRLNEEKVRITDYKDKVFSSDKRLKLALENEDGEVIKSLVGSTARSASHLTDELSQF